MNSKTFNFDTAMRLSISAGLIEGLSHYGASSYNDQLINGQEASIWTGSNSVYVFPSDGGELMEIVSDDGGDDQIIAIDVLDSEWRERRILAQLNGTVPVILTDEQLQPLSISRVRRFINVTGSPLLPPPLNTIPASAHQGTVVVRAQGGGTTYAHARAADQAAQAAIVSTAADQIAVLDSFTTSINRDGNTDANVIFRYMRRDFGQVPAQAVRFGMSRRGTGLVHANIETVDTLPPKSDIQVVATADSNGLDVSARVSFIFFKTGA